MIIGIFLFFSEQGVVLMSRYSHLLFTWKNTEAKQPLQEFGEATKPKKIYAQTKVEIRSKRLLTPTLNKTGKIRLCCKSQAYRMH